MRDITRSNWIELGVDDAVFFLRMAVPVRSRDQEEWFMPHIVIKYPEQQDIVRELGERLTVGRAKQSDVVIDDPRASRNHAEIFRAREGKYLVTDLGSINGTWVNGRRLSAPRNLQEGDIVVIADVALRFVAPIVPAKATAPESQSAAGTAAFLRQEWVIVLVSDIRGYTRMSESLPQAEFSALITEWFRECREAVESNGGTIDKFIGDAVMAYWIVGDKSNLGAQVNAALEAAKGMDARAKAFSKRFSERFTDHCFRIGIGVNMGDAIVGNVEERDPRSFTLVGDSVNIAFRLESLTKELGHTALVSNEIRQNASPAFRFDDLGETKVKGRLEPVTICALLLN
jgi:adenylate cyclase